MSLQVEHIKLSDFTRDINFYGQLELLITVKSFELQAIRKRYLESRKRGKGKAGSVARRRPAKGGIARLKISKGTLTSEEVLVEMTEPRGIDVQKGLLSVAAEDTVYILNGNEVRTITQPWFSYIHTVQFSPHEPERILISSSGFDIFFEYSFAGQMQFEWLAWEHGFDRSTDPETGQVFRLTRNPALTDQFTVLINDPPSEPVPTAKRAAFINSVTYHQQKPDLFLATFFHDGSVMQIDRSGSAQKVLHGLKNPHGGRDYLGGFMATSTASGEIVMQDENLQQRLQFKGLPGKDSELEDAEWIQNCALHENLLIAIDSNRTSIVIADPQLKVFDIIPYNNNWAVQDLVVSLQPLDPAIELQLRGLA